jgi:hypothetical protein
MPMRTQWILLALFSLLLTLGAATCAPHVVVPVSMGRALQPDGAVSGTEPTLPGGRIPEKPYEWQKTPKGNPPRCDRKEVLIKGACYRRAHPDDYAPPCESPTVLWEGTCYYATHKAVPPTSSVGREK